MATNYTIKGIQSESQSVSSENDAVIRHTINSNTNRKYSANNCGIYEHIEDGLACLKQATGVMVKMGMGCLYGRDFELTANVTVEVELNTSGKIVVVYDENIVNGADRFYLTSIKNSDTVVQQDILNGEKMFMMPLCSYVATDQVDDITTIQNAQLNDESLFGELTTLNNNKVNKSDLDAYVKLSNNSTTLLDSYLGYMNKDAKQPMRINNYVNGKGENTMRYIQMFPTSTSGVYTQNGFYVAPKYVVHFADDVERRMAHLDQVSYVMNSTTAKLVDAEYKNKTLDYVFWDIMNKCRANQDERRDSKTNIFSDMIDASMPNFRTALLSYIGGSNTVFSVNMRVDGDFYYSNTAEITIMTDDGGVQDLYTLMYNNISPTVTATTEPTAKGDTLRFVRHHVGSLYAEENASVGTSLGVGTYLNVGTTLSVGGKSTFEGEPTFNSTIRAKQNLELSDGSIYLKTGRIVRNAQFSDGTINVIDVQNTAGDYTWYEQTVNNAVASAATIRNMLYSGGGDTWYAGYNINMGNSLGGSFTYYYKGAAHTVSLNTTRLAELQTLAEIDEQNMAIFEERLSALEEDNAKIMEALGLEPTTRKQMKVPTMKTTEYIQQLIEEDEEIRRIEEEKNGKL